MAVPVAALSVAPVHIIPPPSGRRSRDSLKRGDIRPHETQTHTCVCSACCTQPDQYIDPPPCDTVSPITPTPVLVHAAGPVYRPAAMQHCITHNTHTRVCARSRTGISTCRRTTLPST